MVVERNAARDSFKIATKTKYCIVAEILAGSTNRRVPAELMASVSNKFGCSKRSVQRIMNEYYFVDFDEKPNARLRKSMLTDEVKRNIEHILMQHKGAISYRTLVVVYEANYGVKISLETMWRYLQKMGIKEITSRVKP